MKDYDKACYNTPEGLECTVDGCTERFKSKSAKCRHENETSII